MKVLNMQLKKKLNEVFFIEPVDLGIDFFTNLYKKITSYLKTTPFIIIVPLSLIFAAITYLIFGFLLIRLVNLLRYGF